MFTTILAALASILALFSTRPNKKWLAYIAAFIMISVALWQGYSEYKKDVDNKALKKHIYSELHTESNRILSLVSRMIVESSSGVIPTKEEEFFSDQVAYDLCWHLNFETDAPVIPKRKWLVWMSQEIKDVGSNLNLIISNYGSVLPASTIDSISKVLGSFLFNFPQHFNALRNYDKHEGNQRPPILCPGLEDLMHESLIEIKELYNQIKSFEDSNNISPIHEIQKYKNIIGKSRFTENDLKLWKVKHPYAPSGRPNNHKK
jgi:hypothetical protein